MFFGHMAVLLLGKMRIAAWGGLFMTASGPGFKPAPQAVPGYVDTCKERLCIVVQVFTQGGRTFLLENT